MQPITPLDRQIKLVFTLLFVVWALVLLPGVREFRQMLHGWGWTLFGLAWGIAAAGILFRIVFGVRYRGAAVASYIALGWLCVIAVKPILETVPAGALALIVAGGVAYTSGVFFFATKRLRHGHAIWHLFVLCGSVCHYLAVVICVLPTKS